MPLSFRPEARKQFTAAHIRRLSIPTLWVTLWLTALAVPWLPPPLLALALPPLMFSVIRLAPARPQGRRLVLAAACFWLFWSLLMLLAHFFSPKTDLRPSLNLAVWLNLGLILVLAWTPLELALAAADLSSPLLGRVRAQKMALALALLIRLLPALLASALTLRTVLSRRTAGLSLTRRLTLWGRNLIRNALGQSEELARALAKRWPW